MSWSLAVERTVTGMGYDLVDVERSGGGLLRVTIDRIPGTAYPTGESEAILIEDCEAVTRQLRYVLEVENVDFNRLEVSSPGLDRPLKREADFARFVGETAEVTFKVPFQGRKKFQGELQQREGGWRLVLPPPVAPRKPGTPGAKPGKAANKAAARSPKAAAQAAAAAAATATAGEGAAADPFDQVLDFTLDELRDARLVPVIDFKGRRGQAATPAAALEGAGDNPSDDGGQEQ